MLGLPGCVHTVNPPPSQAVQDVHQRLAARAGGPAAARNACEGLPDEVEAEVSFVYGKSDLDDFGRGRLADTKVWLACHPDARVAVKVKPEPHYRNPQLEADLTAQRGAAVLAYLQAAGIPETRILKVSAADDVLTVPSARLWLVANGNGF